MRKTDAVTEGRTMQFAIEQACLTACSEPDPKKLAKLPIIVWVEIPAVPATDYPCSGMVYKVVPQSVVEVMQRGIPARDGSLSPHSIFVCEHMGHLIE